MAIPPELRFGPFRLDRVNQSLWRGREEIALTPKAFAVLLYIADRAGQLVTKTELIDAVWGDVHVTDGALKRCVVEIRRALQDTTEEPHYIQTLHGRGYRFLAVHALPADTRGSAAGGRQPVVVGRQHEFEHLDASLEHASSGARQIVFITGEAGLGKTTLVDKWTRTVASRESGQPAVGRGRCLQQFGSGEPYLPIFEALDQLSRALGPRLVSILRTHAPTWLLHMPSLISLQDHVRLRDEVFGTTRERMLREITDALEALSGDTPVVLVLEDLHWSDPSTIDLLTSIGSRSSAAQIMIVATYRPSDVGSTHPLSLIQHELEIHGQCSILPLGYLTEADIRDYLAWKFSEADPHNSLVASLHRRTSGNPLFVTCVVDELVRSGGIDLAPEAIREILPNTLQRMFERQSDQLSEAERKIVEAASAEGELFSTASIASVLGGDRGEVEAACEDLVERQMFLRRAEPIRFPDGTDSTRYSFLHVLCRDALYRRLAPARRAKLHALLGRAYEEIYAADPARIAAELAGHFELGGEFPKAIRYLRMAADGAAARFANREAAGHLERAIHLIDRLKDADSGTLRMDLLEQRALMRLSTMDLPGSAADLAAVGEQARLMGNVNRQVKALLDSVMPWGFLSYHRALEVIEEAHRLSSGADPVLAALVDAFRGGVPTYFFGWTQERESYFNAAQPTLSTLTDLGLRIRYLWMEAFVRNGASDFAAACRVAEEFRVSSRKAGSFHHYFLATHNYVTSLVHQGRLGEAMHTAREDAELASRNHHLLEKFWFESLQSFVAIEAFDYATATHICERIAREPIMLNFNLTPHVLLWLGMARLGAGDVDSASEALGRMAVAVDAGGVGSEYRFPLLQGQAACAFARGDLDSARSLALRSIRLAEEHRAPGSAARGYRLLSEIASNGGDATGSMEHISAAMKAIDGSGILNEEWQVHAAAARAFAAVGRVAESESAGAHALAIADRVASNLSGEPTLRKSLLDRVQSQLASRAAGM